MNNTLNTWLDKLKWLIIFSALIMVPIANSFYQEYSLFYRVLASLIAVIFLLFIVASTQKGSVLWEVIKSARQEMRKVVWPTAKERNQTTIIVIALSIVVAIFLSLLDFVFSKVITWILS